MKHSAPSPRPPARILFVRQLRATFTLPTVLAVAAVLALGSGCGSLQAESGDAEEAQRIAEVLQLAPGMTVADVGAGDGEWTTPMARQVGEEGMVWATEVDPEELEKIRQRIEDEQITNVRVVEGDQETLGLPEGCCDAILLRMVYHHFEDPSTLRPQLYQALRPGGRIAIIDIQPQEHWRELPNVPERGGHGIPPNDLVEEMTASGFRFLERHDQWDGDEDRYCAVFER
ncbi:MAG: class I SAM-dependent methyltransferase [Acidobacteriota bacterium]|nr:class I SAM-dependent methyltransferase [Acidobacteriota bacterium]